MLVVASVVGWPPGPARAGTRSLAAARAEVPFGAVSVSLSCSVVPTGAQGAWIAAFTVDADATGMTESSVTALGWWGDGRIEVVVRSGGDDLVPAPHVDVTSVKGSFRVTISAAWGGWHRVWPATMRSGCASSHGSVEQVAAIVNGTSIGTDEPARMVTAGPRDFDDAVALRGTTVVRGSVTTDAGYLMGVFSARRGAISATAPDGTVEHASGTAPSIPVRGGFGGTWRFDAHGAVSDDPYLLTAIAFDRR